MTTNRMIPLSIHFSGHGLHEYECAHPWPAECFCQAGTDGLVLAKDESYTTAFFEAFPRDPDTFIRGEGESVQKAEESAWLQYEKYSQCPNHEFERRGYTNGAGFCKHCGMFGSYVFEPSTLCCICGKPTNWTQDTDGKYYCEEDQRHKPLEKWFLFDWDIPYIENEMMDSELQRAKNENDILLTNYKEGLEKLYQAGARAVELAHEQKEQINDPINWGDLYCTDAEIAVNRGGEIIHRLYIEEAAPGSNDLIQFVLEYLRSNGFMDMNIQVITEW